MATAFTQQPSVYASYLDPFPDINSYMMPSKTGFEDEPEPTQAELLKRVLSAGSTASTRENVTTPKSGATPLSPSSGGGRTPKAQQQGLQLELPEVKQEEGRKTAELTHGLDGLNVRSPHNMVGMLPINTFTVQPDNRQTTHDRSFSSSTEGSSMSMNHPQIPAHLGSSYGSEGFPILHNASPEDEPMMSFPSPKTLQLQAQAAAQVAAADEAIKKINGTDSVFQGLIDPTLQSLENPYQLPRSLTASFTQPQERSDRKSPEFLAHRQSSTSSSTNDSTSSEESDLCVPTIQWVNRSNAVSPGAQHNFYNSPMSFAGVPLQERQKSGRSPNRMPPPTSTHRGKRGEERPDITQLPSLPLGATAHTPGGLKHANSALPAGLPADAPAEEEDDEATVGNGRERSPSTSSQSAQSGLDLLWRAATHPKPKPPTEGADVPHDSKGKRKAGAEAVAQWRESGIPTGQGDVDQTQEQVENLNQLAELNSFGAIFANEPKKKRRRSENQEAIDPALRDPDTFGQPTFEREDDFMTDSENQASENGSEYHAGKPKGRAGVRQKAGTSKGRRMTTHAQNGIGASNGSGSKASGSSGKKKTKTESPNGGGGGSGGGGGGGGGGRRTSGGAAGPTGVGVQCEYVNPLPPYNRCLDVFTRKYDLPRHMARHARREGELVMNKDLPEEKALLWKTIKDKPKVTCDQCNESFTRMDALKRHQTKQHHS